MDPELCNEILQLFLKNADIFAVVVTNRIQQTYPQFFKLCEDIWEFEGKVMHCEVFEYLGKIIKHVKDVFELAPLRLESNYEFYDGEEVYGQIYPCFPLKKEDLWFSKIVNERMP